MALKSKRHSEIAKQTALKLKLPANVFLEPIVAISNEFSEKEVIANTKMSIKP